MRGKGCFLSGLPCCSKDHPRVCGEKFGTIISDKTVQRITPAYAGKSREINQQEEIDRDHPRVCGEKTKKIP